MKIYNYHPYTGIFLGEDEADQDPLDPDNFLIPAHATTTEPPSVLQNSQAVFQNGSWSIVEIPQEQENVVDPEPISDQDLVNRKARAYLNSTDWYVIRMAETGAEIPEAILTARAEARASVVE
jgi:hypothetical protein